MRASDLQAVRVLDLFRSMGDSSFATMMLAAYYQSFPPHLELICEGDLPDFLYIVVEGRVELYSTANRRESSICMVEPVSTFILAAVLSDSVYLMSARTECRSRVLMIPAENVRQAFEVDAAFARSIVQDLAGAFRAVIKDHKNLKLRSSVERLANRLLQLDSQQGGEGIVNLPYDKRAMASLLGMTPENLSRAFNKLKPYGVEVNGTAVRLSKRDALCTLAKPNLLIDDSTI